MEDLIIDYKIVREAIAKAMPEIVRDKLSSSYSSPLAKTIEEELNKKEGQLRCLVSDIITRAISDEEFKKRLAEKVLEKIIAVGLSK